MPELLFEKCTGCGACAGVCPKSAITMRPNDEGFLYPVINKADCVNCGLCGKICSVNTAGNDETFSEKEFSVRPAFACIALDEKVRAESSSGGMFSMFAEKIISTGGVVFGAEFAEDFSVRLGWIETVGGLARLRGSKYVQARTENSFAECRSFLEEGRKVLFTGTPCQIAGLKSFLRKDYANLITADFICHGVPSPALWQKYVNEKSANNRKITKINFRDKSDGWKNYSFAVNYADGSFHKQIFRDNKYMRLFLKDNALRESCYQCPFRDDNRKSDMTLADFWGVENILPEFFDDKGTSLVIIQSEKGQELFDSCRSAFRSAPTDFRAAVKRNPAYFENKKKSRKRNLFYKNFDRHGIDRLYRRFGRDSFATITARFAKRVVRKAARCVFGKKLARKG